MCYFLKKLLKGSDRPGAHRRLGGASTHFALTFLSRNLDQNTLKNAPFLKKFGKNCRSKPPLASDSWGLRPQTPELFSPALVTLLRFYNAQKL